MSMRRIAYPEGQSHLWPDDTLHASRPCHPAPIAPLPALPIAENDEIDSARACSILGVSDEGLRLLLDRGSLKWMQKKARGPLYISYASMVAFCDRLCIEHAIAAKRTLRRSGRFADKELLPFPLEETVYIAEVAEKLRTSETTARRLCESGTLVSYRLHPRQYWRIHRPSLSAYLFKIGKR